nr:restriction endonuclease subunit S [Segatella copri]
MRNLLVPIPANKEQKLIIDKLSSFKPLLEKFNIEQLRLERLNVELYPILRKSILQEAIQGKLVPQIAEEGTAKELLEQIRAEKQRLVKEGKLKKSALNDSVIFRGDDNRYYEQIGKNCVDITEEIPFSIPANWKWVRIRDVFQLNPKNEADNETLAAFIPMEKISAGYKSDFTFDLVKWGNIKKGFTHFANGDVAFAKITPCFQNRKSAIFHGLPNGIGAGTTELKVLRPYGNTIGRWYLLYFLESPYFIDEATFKGTANQQRIVVGYLENKLFPLPPRKQQQRIVEKIEQLMQLLK